MTPKSKRNLPDTSNNKDELDAELIEKLAAIEHERWAMWQRYLHSRLHVFPNQILMMHDDYKRWEGQIATPYTDLSEAEKQSDRDQVMRYMPLLATHIEKERLEAALEEAKWWKDTQHFGLSTPAVDEHIKELTAALKAAKGE